MIKLNIDWHWTRKLHDFWKKKPQFCCVEIKIVEFICDEKKKHSNTVKIFKIVKWSSCINIKKVRKFINICVYYQFFIKRFVLISILIYLLLKKNVIFVWKFFQQKIMNILKMKFVNSLILIIIDYKIEKKIIFAIFANKHNWNDVFMQIRNKKRHFFRYENDMWTKTKVKYDDEKLICWAVLKCWKKFRYYFYEMHFILKINFEILIAQLNCSSTNFFDFFMIRWIVWIRLFDFEIRHVKNKKKFFAKKFAEKPLTEKKKWDCSKNWREKMNWNWIWISESMLCHNKQKNEKSEKIKRSERKLFSEIWNDCAISVNFFENGSKWALKIFTNEKKKF